MKKATFLFITIGLFFGKQLKASNTTYILADDPAIQYVGRIDFTNPKAPAFSFPGISIKAKFTGSKVSAVIKDFAAGTATSTNYYNVLIDDVVTMKLMVISSDTLYTLATGLSNTAHTIELVKRTESSVGKSSFYGFVIPGTGSSLLSLPALPSYKIEFIGDSWTCGYGDEVSTVSPNTGFHSTYEDNGRAWGYTVAKKFDAQYHSTSISGRGMYRNNSGTTTGVIPDEFDKIFPGQSLPLWNFSNYVPDLVVIHLGTNDFYPQSWGTPSMLDSASYVNKYIAFIDNLRTQYGSSTKIICAFGNSISDWYPAGQNELTHWRNFINAVVGHFTGLGDNEVYKFELNLQNSPYGEDWHPTIVTHNQMANQIAPYITTITGRPASSYQASTTVLSTANEQSVADVSIFPNPSSGRIHLDGIGENTIWSISDASGKVKQTGKGEEGNIETLESGIYFLKIGEVYLKIVKF
jgi:hypothetical protein